MGAPELAMDAPVPQKIQIDLQPHCSPSQSSKAKIVCEPVNVQNTFRQPDGLSETGCCLHCYLESAGCQAASIEATRLKTLEKSVLGKKTKDMPQLRLDVCIYIYILIK